MPSLTADSCRQRPDWVVNAPYAAFDTRLVEPHQGRFYPSRLLTVPHPDRALFRIARLDPGALTADFNHPLARFASTARVDVTARGPDGVARGSQLFAWAGLEAPSTSEWPDFSDPDGFERQDDAPDTRFYAQPRRVLHIDKVCASRITALYQELLPTNGPVLDLMSSWRSHTPHHAPQAVGLGLNIDELSDNPALSECVVHDLNRDPELPFPDDSFTAVLNCMSIEYLTNPLAVLRSAVAKLQPGGLLLVTFSNRFFPPKVITLWTRLHPVERVGWVLQLLHRCGLTPLHTLVERGLPRASDDRYTGQLVEMDPLMAVWGRKPVRPCATSGSLGG